MSEIGRSDIWVSRKSMEPKKPTERTLVSNRRAARDYEILEKFEAGIELKGQEVKSLRQGRGSLQEAFGVIKGNDIFLRNAHIPRYSHASHERLDERRDRKLLLHRREIEALKGKVARAGLTLVPIRLYLNHGLVKVELALARGRRKYEKREKLKEEEMRREVERSLREAQKTGKVLRIRP
jgi:SsrA-binding protein